MHQAVVIFCSLFALIFLIVGSIAIYHYWDDTSPKSFAFRSFGGISILIFVLFGLIAIFQAYRL